MPRELPLRTMLEAPFPSLALPVSPQLSRPILGRYYDRLFRDGFLVSGFSCRLALLPTSSFSLRLSWLFSSWPFLTSIKG
jgi:hypothetical protein